MGRGSPKNFNRENLKIWLKIQRVHVNDIGTDGDIITNFYPDDVSRASGDNVGTIFWMACRLKFAMAKNVQNPARFLTTFDLDREYLRNASTNRKSKN